MRLAQPCITRVCGSQYFVKSLKGTSDLRCAFLADRKYAEVVERLVSCMKDLRLPEFPLSLAKAPANQEAIQRLKSELGLGASVDRFFAALRWS